MAEVRFSVGDRSYAVDCADEDVERVRELAEELSREVAGLGEQGAGARGILIAALVLIDRERSRAEEAALRARRQAEQTRAAAGRIDALAGRLERMASSVRGRPAAGGNAAGSRAGSPLAASGGGG